ncbi:MAG TPA: undecaprenyl-diphosphate phosphatase [Myxococcota bacterium]
MPPRPEVRAAALGLLQGVTELVPVSSSAHVAAVPWLLGWPRLEPARQKELEVALHAGALLALAPALIRSLPDARTLALSLAPPVALGYLFERPIEERLGGPAGLAFGLLAGAAALVIADRMPEREPRRPGLWLGLAQAAALAPGVSRTGATLAAARALGYSRADASRLSFGVAGPVLAGATALKAWRGRPWRHWRAPAAGAAVAFASTSVALRTLGLTRRAPLWPYAAERALLAVALLLRRRSATP